MSEVEFPCPYCAQPNLLVTDPSGGEHQSFTIDCEICCRPIRITIADSGDAEPDVRAEAELM